MSRQLLTIITCDLCEKQVDHEDVKSVKVNVTINDESHGVELDLCPDHALKAYDALRPFLNVGTPIAPAAKPKVRRAGEQRPTRRDPVQVAAIRTWARENGYPVSDRGRIPNDVEAAYNARSRAA
jgi:hypothetical protein